MFRDKITLKFKAGDGGNGVVRFDKLKKPSGGDGGDGGDVYFAATSSLFDLQHFESAYLYEAQNGGRGGENNKTGARGKDLLIKLPFVTKLLRPNGSLLATIDSEIPQKVLTAGRGGLGNHYFRRGGVSTLRKHTNGKPGEQGELILELELQADAALIGLPNAGKSSVVNALSRANYKVASYAFTTLHPQLGVMDETVIMDLPGLIENTHEGKGLGSSFSRHLRRVKLLLHTISLESADLVGDYKTVRKELDNIDPALAKLPEVILLSKADVLTGDDSFLEFSDLSEKKSFDLLKNIFSKSNKQLPQYNVDIIEQIKSLQKLNKQIFLASVISEESVKFLQVKLKDSLAHTL